MRDVVVRAAFFLLLSIPADASADSFGSGDNSLDIEFVTIGDPGNLPDMTGVPNPAGSVPYEFRMGIYEISRDQIIKSNNIAGLGLEMAPLTNYPDGPPPEIPATGLTWNEAARFVNWLNTSHGFSPAYKFSGQPGDAGYNPNDNILLWQVDDAGYDQDNLFRNSFAHYFLPSDDEWYKAAYYDPNANDGNGGYWDYPYGSDDPPLSVASGTNPGTAVYEQSLVADATEAGGLSPYGVMGLGGNAYEWEETEADLVNDTPSAIRGARGGNWFFGQEYITSSFRLVEVGPTEGPFPAGFRVASIAESLGCDLNGDGVCDYSDLETLQAPEEKLAYLTTPSPDGLGTVLGDVNLDFKFNPDDLTDMFAAGKYSVDADARYDEGDANFNGRFDPDDMIEFFATGNYNQAGATAAVPEPGSLALLAFAALGMLRHRR